MKWKHIWAAALALFFLFILTACGNERIFSASPAETGLAEKIRSFPQAVSGFSLPVRRRPGNLTLPMTFHPAIPLLLKKL